MLYLSQAIGRPVLDAAGEALGRVDDLIVALGDRYPPVTGLVLRTDRRRIFLPWTSVGSFDASGGRLSTATIDITAFKQRANEIQLRADLLDKQIVDIDGRKVVRVNDLRLDDVDGMLHLVAVDVGAAGLLRRLGVEGGFRVLARNLGRSTPERYIDWEDVVDVVGLHSNHITKLTLNANRGLPAVLDIRVVGRRRQLLQAARETAGPVVVDVAEVRKGLRGRRGRPVKRVQREVGPAVVVDFDRRDRLVTHRPHLQVRQHIAIVPPPPPAADDRPIIQLIRKAQPRLNIVGVIRTSTFKDRRHNGVIRPRVRDEVKYSHSM